MKYIIANWKMNMDLNDLSKWVQSFRNITPIDTNKVEVIIAPSHVHLPLLREFSRAHDINISAQDVSVFEQGAHTGETGAFQLKDFCSYCIVGHSERVESLETVYRKREECLKVGIIPMVCFVEPDDCTLAYKSGCFIVWEDPQNISHNGVFYNKDPKEIEIGIKEIRKKIPESAALIYGGSVNKDNVLDLVAIPGLDGVLVGSDSLNPEHFAKIIEAYSKV